VDAACPVSTRSLVNNGIASLMSAVKKKVAVRTTEAYILVDSLIGEQCVEVVFSASCQRSQHGFGSFGPPQIVEASTWVQFPFHVMVYIGMHGALA
jgi:hypothetical protein